MSNIHAISPVDFSSYPTGSTESINPDNSTGQQNLLIGNPPEEDIWGIGTPAMVPPISERDSSGRSPHIEGRAFPGVLTPVHSRLRLRRLRQPQGEESSGETGATRNEYEPPQQHHVSDDQGGSKEEEDGETEKTNRRPAKRTSSEAGEEDTEEEEEEQVKPRPLQRVRVKQRSTTKSTRFVMHPYTCPP